MQSTDDDLKSRGAEATAHVHASRKLVRLNADHAHDAALALQAADDLLDGDDRVRLVVGVDHHVYVVAENARLGRMLGEAVQAGQ